LIRNFVFFPFHYDTAYYLSDGRGDEVNVRRCLPPRPALAPGRDQAFSRLLEARANFADWAEERYASGRPLAARDSERIEEIARRIAALIEDLEREFARLDVARDLCTYLGPAGARVERSQWNAERLAGGAAEVFEALLHPAACQVLAAAIALEIVG
jgi:hypothetical protein